MADSEPIPILLCGKFAGHIQACSDIVEPEYKGKSIHALQKSSNNSLILSAVVRVCSSLEDVRTAVTSFYSSPAHSDNEHPTPRIVVMGGGFSRDDFESVYESIDGAKSVPWVRPEMWRPGTQVAPPKEVPSAEFIAKRLREALDDRLDDARAGKGKEEIWWM
jgi:hypothetical protein